MKTRLNKQQWQVLLTDQEKSGLSVAAFCRDKNLTAKNFYNQRSNKLRKTTGNTQPFVRAHMKPAVRSSSEFTLIYGKLQLRLPAGSSPQWLAELMVAIA